MRQTDPVSRLKSDVIIDRLNARGEYIPVAITVNKHHDYRGDAKVSLASSRIFYI